MARGSQFDEKKELIAKMFYAGAGAKEILEALGEDWYSYEALYRYIRRNFGRQQQKECRCEKCSGLVWMDSPYKNFKIPVCVIRKKVFKRDKSGMPHGCDLFTERSD